MKTTFYLIKSAALRVVFTSNFFTIPDTRDPKTGRTLAHLAVVGGDTDMVTMLVSKGAKLDMVDNEGWTALHHAGSLGYRKMLELLLSGDGAQLVDIKTKAGIVRRSLRRTKWHKKSHQKSKPF